MVAQPGRIQSSTNSGEISEELYSRIDLKQWYAGMKRMLNVEPVPQGGFRLLPRSRHRGRVRGALAEVGGTITSDTTSHNSAAVVKTLTFASATSIELVELSEFHGSDEVGASLQVEYRDVGGAWHDFSPALALGEDSRSRVAARAPGDAVTSTAVRVTVTGMADWVSVTIAGILAYRRTGPAAAAELRDFYFSGGQSYILVVTPGVIDIWRAGVFVGTAFTAIGSSQLRSFKQAQMLDTDLLFHPDIETERLVRAGADHEWEYWPLIWDKIPDVDYGGSYPTTNDVWELFIRWSADVMPEIYMTLTVAGEDTSAVAMPGGTPDLNAFAASIAAAINALPSIGSGVSCGWTASGYKMHRFTITFGGGNAGDVFDVTAQIVNTSDASVLPTHLTIGDRGGEPLLSALRGYAAAAAFFNDRLVMGGFRSKTAAVAASRVGEYFDFNIEAVGDSTAILNNLQTEGSEQISQIYAGRHIMIITDAKEYFVSDRVIKKTETVNFVETGKNGIHPNADIVEINDEVYMVAKNGSLIYAASYDDVSTKYQFEPVSLLASHLIKGVRDAALQRASSATDASRYFVLREDGRLIIGLVIREQSVLGFVEWATDGTVESVAVDHDNRDFLLVRRQVGGNAELFLEELVDDRNLVFDGAISVSFDAPTTTPGGLGVHEGATVWADIDGALLGPYTVADGKITLPEPVSALTVGRWTAPIAECLPRIRVLQDDTVLLRPGRIHTATLNLIGTTSLALGANGERVREVPLYRAGIDVDGPLPPFSGRVTVDGLDGYEVGPTVVMTQLRPGRFAVQDFTLEVGG